MRPSHEMDKCAACGNLYRPWVRWLGPWYSQRRMEMKVCQGCYQSGREPEEGQDGTETE